MFAILVSLSVGSLAMAQDDLGLSSDEEARALRILNDQDITALQTPPIANNSIMSRLSSAASASSSGRRGRNNNNHNNNNDNSNSFDNGPTPPPEDEPGENEERREALLDEHCKDIINSGKAAEEDGGDAPDRQLVDACKARKERAQHMREKLAASADSSEPPRPFGYDLFSLRGNSFAPSTDIPVPTDYALGPGDSLRVQLFGSENRELSLPVSRDGNIDFPKLGPIHVAGEHFDQIKDLIEQRVAREMIGVKASVTLGALRSIRVFVLGDVKQPGSYTVSSLATMTNALYAGGGLSNVGSMRRVQLKRDGRLVGVLDLYDLLLHGNSVHDYRLEPGDVVFVPPVGPRVTVGGSVRRPAIYEVHHERSVGQILALAGGRLPSANGETGQILRFTPDAHQQVIQLDISRAPALQFPVQDGDELKIREINGPLANGVSVLGAVRYPGSYSLTQASTVAQLLASAQVLPSTQGLQAYYPLGAIERSDPITGIRLLQSFNVMEQMSQTGAAMPLAAQDTVIIFTREDIDYLQSTDVRLVANGDRTAAQQCPGLKLLLTLINSQRILQIAHEFTSEQAASATASPTRFQRTQCPEIFRTVPQTLPYLLEQSVAVFGEVQQPGIYPITSGSTVRTVLNSAGGLTREGDASHVEYVSFTDALNRGKSRYQNLDLTSAPTLAERISPGDTFNFRPVYLGQELGRASMRGEFRFPGDYGLLRGERLSQLIRRAGGLTENAYPYGAVFTRVGARQAEAAAHVREARELQESLMTATTSGALGDLAPTAAPLLQQAVEVIRGLPPVGRIVLQADPTLLAAHPEQDVILDAGDLIVMPKRPVTIAVIGQVLNEGTVAFRPGASVADYLDSAGGLTQGADHSRIFLVLPNGSARTLATSFWNYTTVPIPPGSTIVVPRDATPFNGLVFFQKVFGVFSNVAVTAAALATIARNP